MKKFNFFKNNHGLSIVEVVLATALFVIFASGTAGLVIQGLSNNRLGSEKAIATQYASEGIEAVRSIKNQSYAKLVDTGGTGLRQSVSSNVWEFFGANNTKVHNATDNYIRTITISSINRDGSGNIVTSGGTSDPLTKKVTSQVSWFVTSGRQNTITQTAYLTNWRKSYVFGGMLVYGNGGTSSDNVQYRILDAATGTWNAPQLLDFDPGASNKALRVVRMYASPTKNEKIAISRHYNGSQQFIYAHVYDGTSWQSTQLTSWSSSSFDNSNQGIKNFDGDYLANGDFLVVYSNNTNYPQYRLWNGASWSSQAATVNFGGIPTNITLDNRPNTNEALMAVFDRQRDTNTSYYNGTSWAGAVQHSGGAPALNKEFAEFAWSPYDTSKGALIFQTSNSDQAMNLRICTAPCTTISGWTTNNVNTPNQSTLGAMELVGRPDTIAQWLACDKDANNDIYCFRANQTPSWTTPSNNLMTQTTDTGIQRSFDLAYEPITGTDALVVYSDNTATPKLKKYNPTSNSFDAAATSLNNLGGVLKTVKLRTYPENNDDIMILMADANNVFYTAVWDGVNNSLYTTPSGKAFTTQGTNGSGTTEYWYAFAWDRY
ncbi:hypothetical protein HY407_04900 [Candidatus Gottesmanbacteria bacterium]|nr:hypothetical protein [Candidatus Gottesmanbacteria bacterium]